MCTDIPFSPDHTIQHQTTNPLQQHKNRGIPTTYQRGRHQPPSRCCLATQIRRLDRESYADSRSSPCHAPRLQAIDQADSLKTAEYQHSTSAADISHLATNHGADQIHGPNRKSLADSRSGPHNTTSQQTTNRDNHQIAEYQHSSNAQKTINRSTGHQTAHASGPNRKSHTNLGSSPLAQPRRPERRLSNHSITCHSRLQKERRTPTVMRLGNPGR